jgi:flagellar basal-body rod protein FlgB
MAKEASDLMKSVGCQPRKGGKEASTMALIDPTQQLLEAAMRGSWQRQTALTNNIANAETPDYRPEEVNFESQLQSAVANNAPVGEMQFQAEAKAVQAGPNGGTVSVDQESAKLAENGLDYEALTQVLNARNSIERAAMGVS